MKTFSEKQILSLPTQTLTKRVSKGRRKIILERKSEMQEQRQWKVQMNAEFIKKNPKKPKNKKRLYSKKRKN